MVVKVGSQGSICLYYKGLLISSFPLTKKKDKDFYFNIGEILIKESKGIPIDQRIRFSLKFMNQIYHRKINHKPIYKSDHELFSASMFAMMRLRIIDNDEENGYMIFPKKKKNPKQEKGSLLHPQ
jgi:hypothetical protein